jgi:hypothetical protein
MVISYIRIYVSSLKKKKMNRKEFLFNEKRLTYDQLYEHLKRAEERLSRNLSSSLWSFATYTGFHFIFIYAIFSKEMVSLHISQKISVGIIIIGSIVLHLVSLMSINKYRGHLQANEQVIKELESLVCDEQQKAEQERKVRFPSGARKAREIIFWALFTAELGIAIFFALKK